MGKRKVNLEWKRESWSLLSHVHSSFCSVPVLLEFQVSSFFFLFSPSLLGALPLPVQALCGCWTLKPYITTAAYRVCFEGTLYLFSMRTGRCWLSGQSGDVLFLPFSSLPLPDEYGVGRSRNMQQVHLLEARGGLMEREIGRRKTGGTAPSTIELTLGWALHSFCY